MPFFTLISIIVLNDINIFVCVCVCISICVCVYMCVTGFGKTVHVRTRIEIHFIAYYNSHTQALPRHSNKTAIDKKVCFFAYRLLLTLLSHKKTNTDPVGPLKGIKKVTCTLWSQTVQLNVCSPRGMVRGYCVHLSGLLCSLLGQLCLLTLLTHSPSPPSHTRPSLICGTCDIAGYVQKISQNHSVHQVAIYVSVMIAVSLLYFWCRSYFATCYQA